MNIFGTPIHRSFIIQDDIDLALESSDIFSFLEENKVWSCSVKTSYFNEKQKDNISCVYESLDNCVLPLAVNYILPLVQNPCKVWFDNVWVNKYETGNFQERHAHCGSEVSFVYMHKTTENHSALRFHNMCEWHLGEIRDRTGVLFQPLYFDVFLQPREIILFPSYLPHSVVPKNVDGERITLSGNIKVNSI